MIDHSPRTIKSTNYEGWITATRRHSYDFYTLAVGAVGREQSQNRLIHGRELPLLVDGQTKQIGVAYLLVPHESSLKRLDGFPKADFIAPKTVVAVL